MPARSSVLTIAATLMVAALTACSTEDGADARIVHVQSPDGKNIITLEHSGPGPMDYHLGGFRSVSPARFQPRYVLPEVLGTRCHHLAMYVVYENPMPMISDTPSSYEGQPGFQFLKDVPITWDETQFLAGEAGDFVVVGRRKDTTWYLGGMTNDTAREITVPLRLLDPGNYEAELFVDSSLSTEEPNAIRLERRAVTAEMSLEVTMAPGGGFVATIRPKPAS